MEETKGKPEPIRQSVRVDCPIDDAFRLFTEEFAEWWPLAEDGEIEPWEEYSNARNPVKNATGDR